jgi:hypothetical protein
LTKLCCSQPRLKALNIDPSHVASAAYDKD